MRMNLFTSLCVGLSLAGMGCTHGDIGDRIDIRARIVDGPSGEPLGDVAIGADLIINGELFDFYRVDGETRTEPDGTVTFFFGTLAAYQNSILFIPLPRYNRKLWMAE